MIKTNMTTHSNTTKMGDSSSGLPSNFALGLNHNSKHWRRNKTNGKTCDDSQGKENNVGNTSISKKEEVKGVATTQREATLINAVIELNKRNDEYKQELMARRIDSPSTTAIRSIPIFSTPNKQGEGEWKTVDKISVTLSPWRSTSDKMNDDGNPSIVLLGAYGCLIFEENQNNIVDVDFKTGAKRIRGPATVRRVSYYNSVD